ncbi:hypothetical protein [Natrarchaeobius chitinivorans]|uniref:Uncharacterized protein n=1 Tax=Natrarchaeobius chitinivorans TaxID=1679083 RepID=A0A3N6LVK7_NATCH|nr:hypothetical protein [Natrarchaeobius chitinivorans]RQG94483.1 hypothetical protein EA473_12125 [Natrarchaeobius chitinivorans]
MPEVLIGATVALLGGIALALLGRRRWRTRNRRALARELEERLGTTLAPGTASHLETAPSVRQLAVVDRVETAGGDSQPVYIPVVRIDLETTDAPGMDLIYEYVADALEAIHPTLVEREERVAHYDVEFTFGPDGLFVEGECRRVSVPPELVERLVTEESYRAFDLQREIKRGDRTDGPSVLWAECTRY